MKITALIPARKNSERFPGKNYALFLNKPLFLHAVDFARESSLVTDYFVTTNDEIIINICYNMNIPYIKRPGKYCLPTSDNTEYVNHFLNHLIINRMDLPDALLILQPTDPIRQHSYFNEIFKIFTENTPDCVFTVVKCKTKMGKIKNGEFIPYNYHFEQRFQDMDEFYEENGMFYLLNVNSFIRNRSFFGKKNIPYIIPEFYRNMDIDTKLEMQIAELTFNKFIAKI